MPLPQNAGRGYPATGDAAATPPTGTDKIPVGESGQAKGT